MSKPLRHPKIIGYELVDQIGGGGFSSVFRAIHFRDQRVAACKLIHITGETSQPDRKMFEKEIRVHSILKHPNVLEFLTAIVVEPNGTTNYIPGIYMLLELAAGGDLFDKIAPDVGVGEEIAHFYFCQLAHGIDYIHQQGICHRDLKPENILLDAVGVLKISDFGLSSVFKLKDSGETRLLTERCGSLPYVAPELNTDFPYQAEPIDIWGLGVILFTLLAGNTPWDEPTDQSLEFRQYVTGEIFYHWPWDSFSESVMDLLTALLTINPKDRLKIHEIFQHPWYARPSQVASQGPVALANKLTESIRATGDLDIAAPSISRDGFDDDGDQVMASATNSQFTQSLLLFSQTQSGTRYTPALTRFYCDLGPSLLMSIIHESLCGLNVKCKPAPVPDDNSPGRQQLRIRVGGLDRRKVAFKGWVIIESFVHGGRQGSFCVMQRDEGSPLSWRQLWKALIKCDSVEPHVLKK